MPGVVFLIVVPTANFERELFHGQQLWDAKEILPSNIFPQPPQSTVGGSNSSSNAINTNNLNINIPDNKNAAFVRLEVELRDKNAGKRRGRGGKNNCGRIKDIGAANEKIITLVPMEKILEELLSKLEIEHVTWSCDKKGYYYHVVFPIPAGEPCETTLHCLTELGIGTKLNSSVSVLPCSVSYDAISDAAVKDEFKDDDEELSKWNNFVDSIKSKLTVKQVVDGVRAGGSMSFDYVLLIVTADSLAALGLVENNAPNIVAAMLVSPLMGPVMSITFGTIISDRELIKVGFATLALGMFLSLLFGFIFGLILGTTEMPWGPNDWPTEEMKGRGNARSLWMGVLWALTSGTGVAVALLQGSAGPLIGVAISASLLPPVVNCGLFWALACIWLIYPGIKMPHIKGEPYVGNSSYEFIYTNYLPTEFLISGIVSGLLTVVNVICIFITAIIVLKIKEVSAPYTASPDLKRFWETDLRTARKTNRSSIRQRKTLREKHLPYGELKEPRNRELEAVLEQAIQEATDDVTLQKVKNMSYSSNAAGELTQKLQHPSVAQVSASGLNSLRNSKINATDLQTLDKLVTTLLEQQKNKSDNSDGGATRKGSVKLNRLRPFSRSIHNFISGSRSNSIRKGDTILNSMSMTTTGSGNSNNTNSTGVQHTSSLMPTIMEQSSKKNSASQQEANVNMQTVRNVLNSIANAPRRFSQRNSNNDNENINLTQNIID